MMLWWQEIYGLGLVAYALLSGHLRHNWEPYFATLMTGMNGVALDRVHLAHRRPLAPMQSLPLTHNSRHPPGCRDRYLLSSRHTTAHPHPR